MKEPVRSFMSTEVATLAPHDTLQTAVMLEMRHHIRHIPILENGSLIGVVTDRDLKRAMPSLLSGIDRDTYERVMTTTTVGQIMTKSPTTIGPDDDLVAALTILTERKFGGLPVVEGDRLVGILTETDLLRAFRTLLESR